MFSSYAISLVLFLSNHTLLHPPWRRNSLGSRARVASSEIPPPGACGTLRIVECVSNCTCREAWRSKREAEMDVSPVHSFDLSGRESSEYVATTWTVQESDTKRWTKWTMDDVRVRG